MLGLGGGPGILKGMNVGVLVSALANTVCVEDVRENSFCIGLCVMSALKGTPVTVIVTLTPALFLRLKVLTRCVIAHVADTVVVFIGVRSLCVYGDFMLTGNCVPVLCLVRAPFGSVGVLMVIIPLAALYVADAVLVFVDVSAGYVSLTLVALKVSVCVNVLGAGHGSVTLIALKVSVSVLMRSTSKLTLAQITEIIFISVGMLVAVYVLRASVAFIVAVLVNVLIAGDKLIALIAIVVFVFINVSLAFNRCSAFVTFEVFVFVNVAGALH